MAKKNNRQIVTVEPETGKVYKLRHERFGKAVVKIIELDTEWIDVKIVSVTFQDRRRDWEAGDIKTVRRSRCFFSPK